MYTFRMACYCISHICMMLFLFVFARRRFSVGKTAAILSAAALALVLLELLGSGFPVLRLLASGLQLLTLQGTSLLISGYRDARGVFTGLGASNYVLPGVMVSLYLYVLTGCAAAALILEIAIHLFVLGVLSHSLLPAYQEIQMGRKEQWGVMCLMPFLFYLSAVWLELAVRGSGKPVSALFTVIFFLLTMYACYLLVFRMIWKLQKDQQAVKEREILRAGIRALKWEEMELRAAKQKIAAHIRDRKNLTDIMRQMMAKNDYEGVMQMLVKMQGMTEVRQTERHCSNAAVNGVMVYYVSEARRLGIRVFVRMDVPENLRVSEWELAVVVGNLMDNALLACEKAMGNAEIQVTARTVHAQFLLEIRNTCVEAVDFDKKSGLPLSGRGENHGIGMHSVAYFAEKNQVILDCGTENGMFFTRLLI